MNVQNELAKKGYQARKHFSTGGIEVYKIDDGYLTDKVIYISGNELVESDTSEKTLDLIIKKIDEQHQTK